MTDLAITAASVVPGANANIVHRLSGATITAGQPVYDEAATRTMKLSDSNSATVEQRAVYGIALHAASAGQPLSVLIEGDLTIGATLVAGAAYYLSETPGGIQPVADLAAGENVVLLGLAKSTTVLAVKIFTPGVVL